MCGQAPAAIPRPIVTLRVFAHAMMDVPALEQATSTAGRLLESAGIGIEWRNCDGVQETCAQPDTATQVTVLLLPMTKFTRDDVAAEVLHDRPMPMATVLVYMPNLADRLRSVHQRAGRSNPALSSLQMEDLVGLAIAHEIGHASGLPHAPAGIMNARITREDLLALVTSRLTFTPKEAAVLAAFLRLKSAS
jgi:hypothetical protein